MGWAGWIGGGMLSLAMLAGPNSVLAAESISELPTGAIEFLKPSDPAALILDSEEMRVTPEAVTVAYRLSNTSDAPLDLTLRFASPDLDFADPDVSFAIPGSDPVNFLGAAVKIDGKPAAFAAIQRAILNDKDVTDLLRRAKLALVPIGTFQNELAEMPEPARQDLITAGAIKEAGATVEGNPIFYPAWTVRTSSSRKLTIPPKKAVAIDLRYLASVGLSRDTVLRKGLRGRPGLATEVRDKKAAFCIDDGFLNGLDAITSGADNNASALAERRMRIVPRGGVGAEMPAVQYRLVIDKGRSQRIVSFCLDNLKKISPTAFEMRMENHVPKPSLDFLMIDKGDPVAR